MATISFETAEWRMKRGKPSFIVNVERIPHYFNDSDEAAAFADRLNITEILDFETGRLADYTPKEHA